jgi:ABC-type cobalamin/Fe3+-siderophores transport system ATPase subunit
LSVAALQFQGVSKAYAGTSAGVPTGALSDFTLTVNAGECFGLVGANGAGKTTLIKCLLDFCEPNAGAIAIFGVPHRLTASRARLALAHAEAAAAACRPSPEALWGGGADDAAARDRLAHLLQLCKQASWCFACACATHVLSLPRAGA